MTNIKDHKSEEPRHIPVESDEDNAKLSENQRKAANRDAVDQYGNPIHYADTPAGRAGLPDQKHGQDESQPPEEKPDAPVAIPGHLHR